MRYLISTALIAAVAACSPTTDITQSSNESFAGRTRSDVLRTEAQGDLLRVRIKVQSMRAARTVAEDIVVQKRGGFDRVQVEVLGPSDAANAHPAAVLRWSTRNGFEYSENR